MVYRAGRSRRVWLNAAAQRVPMKPRARPVYQKPSPAAQRSPRRPSFREPPATETTADGRDGVRRWYRWTGDSPNHITSAYHENACIRTLSATFYIETELLNKVLVNTKECNSPISNLIYRQPFTSSHLPPSAAQSSSSPAPKLPPRGLSPSAGGYARVSWAAAARRRCAGSHCSSPSRPVCRSTARRCPR